MDLAAALDGVLDQRSADGGSPSPDQSIMDLGPSPDQWGTMPVADVANDTCATPAWVDLAPLPSGQRVSVLIATMGANRDYGMLCVGTWPEVVLRLTNSPGALMWGCTGGGGMGIVYSTDSSAPCPGNMYDCASMSPCDGSQMSEYTTSGTAYLQVYRDPAAGPATLILDRLP